MYYFQWKPYVSVAERRRRAMRKMESLRKKGVDIQPVEIQGRQITRTFWGEAWCKHLEMFSDFENRLPRGRTYVRNGSVCHLAIDKGKVDAKVSGSSLYSVSIRIKTIPAKKWALVKKRCGGQIGSLIELLQGHLSENVMAVVTDRDQGLFPLPKEISFHCNCPDWARMCKHVAAVLYGIGARLDQKPELLFKLRGVDHEDLIAADAEAAISKAVTKGKSKRLTASKLSDVFGIELVPENHQSPSSKAPKKKAAKVPKNKAEKKAAKSPKAKAAKTKKKTIKKTAKKRPLPKFPARKRTTKKSKKKASKR
ncbi:MAG: hypothetical protein JW829_09800 [Pirellulales bacterium]|nr:hypothetical protein [Pirellulales bacterium]